VCGGAEKCGVHSLSCFVLYCWCAHTALTTRCVAAAGCAPLPPPPLSRLQAPCLTTADGQKVVSTAAIARYGGWWHVACAHVCNALAHGV
jgi:hypothetical protein